MKKKLILILGLVILLGSLGTMYFYSQYSRPKFSIFIAKPDPNSAGNYIVSDTPIITEKDISKYYWPEHQIKLTDEFMKNHNPSASNYGSDSVGGSGILNASSDDIAIVKLKGKEIYRAGFPIGTNKIRSNNLTLTIKDIPDVNSFDIIGGYLDSKPNSARYNEDLRKMLKKLNLLVEH